MRALILAALLAMGVGLAGAPVASAAPVNGAAIGSAADAANLAEQVQWHSRRRSWRHRHGHWRWGSYHRPRIICRHDRWSTGRRCWRRW
ncbi:MAG: hypothetical protein M5U07_04745 [Xanthobacteraceae bacterium]|nr:hypothetical protein [Xanthobacteraceae bacterium]